MMEQSRCGTEAPCRRGGMTAEEDEQDLGGVWGGDWHDLWVSDGLPEATTRSSTAAVPVHAAAEPRGLYRPPAGGREGVGALAEGGRGGGEGERLGLDRPVPARTPRV